MNKKFNNLKKVIKARRASRLLMSAAKSNVGKATDTGKAKQDGAGEAIPDGLPEDEAATTATATAAAPEEPKAETATTDESPTQEREAPAKPVTEAPAEEAAAQTEPALPEEAPAKIEEAAPTETEIEAEAPAVEATGQAEATPKKRKSYYRSKKKS